MKRSLRSWLWQVPLHDEVDEELAFHLEMRTRELVEKGMDPNTAREVALSRMGDVPRLKRTCMTIGRKRDRDMRLTQWIEEFRDDVKYALRQLRAAPGFTAVAVITLALGIGANSAIFALADAVLLRPLPFGQPDRLVRVWDTQPSSPRNTATPLDLIDWQDNSRTVRTFAAFIQNGTTMTGDDGVPELVPNHSVTWEFFEVLDVRPIAGRTFRRSDLTDLPSAIVLSEPFWKQRFGGDPTIVGRAVRIGLRPRTVIGIVSAEFQILSRSAFFDLLPDLRTQNIRERRLHFLHVVGKLADDATLDSARTEMQAIAAEIARRNPDSNTSHGVSLEPLRDSLIGPDLRLTALLFVGVVGFVLLMCCANVANLLLTRTSARARELAVRSALGAGRLRIAMQLLTESIVLSVIGGVLAAGIGALILRLAPRVIPPDLLPPAVTLQFDTRVITFCVAAALLTGLLFGLAPVWQTTGMSLVQAITSEGRAMTRRGGRFRSILVAGEVAAAVLLLCSAGLLLRTLIAVGSIDPGYSTTNVLTASVNVPGAAPNLKYWTPESRVRFFDAVEREVRALPGVASAGWGSTLPLDGPGVVGSMSFEIAGERIARGAEPQAQYQMVTPGYFETLGIRLVNGRSFSPADTADAVPVAVVNEAFARRHLPGRNAIGTRVAVRQMAFGPEQIVVREIVGVVRQVATLPYESERPAQIYVPLAQNPWIVSRLVVRPTRDDAAALVPAVRAAVARVDKERAVTMIRTMDDVSRAATARQRFRATLSTTFAALALLLAMVGVFGVLAYSVQQRMREFGVRVALGASARDVLRLVLVSAIRLTGIGGLVGLIMAAIVSRWIATLLFGVQPLDPMTFASAAVLLGITVAIATIAPALRASRVDPVVTFRNE